LSLCFSDEQTKVLVLPAENNIPLPFCASNVRRQNQLIMNGYEPDSLKVPKLDFSKIITNPKIIIITASDLYEQLEFWESTNIQWHIDRGLSAKYTKRTDIFVVSSRFPSAQDSNNPTSDIAFFQEIHSVGTKNNGYFFHFVLKIYIKVIQIFI